MQSVRRENAAALAVECPFVRVVTLLGVHWRPVILWKIAHGVATYNALRRAVNGVTDKMLSTELLALASAGLIARVEISARPRRTRYELTAYGAGLIPVLEAMDAWCTANGPAERPL